ncbi:MAG: glycosyltransferase [Acidimicrobiales bacterium]|nr:glycosyltransferase [Acidimicrobiales bacterium]
MATNPVTSIVGKSPQHIAAEHDPAITLSLVIPTYNEAGNIATLVRSLHQQLSDAQISHELIVVDDNSPDGTSDVVTQLTTEIPTLRLIHRNDENGLATAVICGWHHAHGALLGVIDGDGQHPPDTLPKLVASLSDPTNPADIAVASRHLPGGGVPTWSASRRLLSQGAQTLGSLLLPGTVGQVTDPMSGYFVVKRQAIAGCDLQPVGYKILLEVLARGDIHQVVETPYYFLERETGSSKVKATHYLDYLRHLLRLRVQPLRSQALGRYLMVSLMALLLDGAIFFWLFDTLGWNLTRSALIAGEAGILFTIALLDLWTFAGRPARTSLDRYRRLIGVQLAHGILLIGRLALINFLITWTNLGPLTVFFSLLIGTAPLGHLLGSRLSWRPTRN